MRAKMAYISLERALLLGALALAVTAGPGGASADDTLRERVGEELKKLWESLGTISIEAEEFPCDANGLPILDQGYSRVKYAMRAGGERAHTFTEIKDGTEEIVTDMRSDGRQRYYVEYFEGHPRAISSIHVANEKEPPDDGRTGVTRPLWHLTPFGRPVHVYLDSATCELKKDADGTEYVLVEFTLAFPQQQHVERHVSLELDPQHDWLVRRATIQSKFGGRTVDIEARVTRFGQDNGRWFPMEGIESRTDAKGTKYSGFRVSHLKINRHIADSVFRPPVIAEGVLVVDEATNTGRFKGGLKARKALEARYPQNIARAPNRESSRPAGAPIQASRNPEGSPWPLIIGLAGLIVLITAGYLAFRRGHS